MGWTFYNSNGQRLSSAATNISVLDINSATDIGEDIANGDLLIIDNGADGTNRKTTVDRIKTYVGAAPTEAVQTDMEEEPAGSTNANRYVSPEVAHFARSAIKGHAYVIADGTLQSNNYNVSSASKDSTGNYAVNWDNDMDSGTYSILGMAGASSGAQISFDGRAAGQLGVETWEAAGGQADKEFGCAICGAVTA